MFGGSSHPELVKLICEKLNLPVGKAKCTKFANGETNGKFFCQFSPKFDQFFKLEENLSDGSDLNFACYTVNTHYKII